MNHFKYIIISPNSEWGGGEKSLWNFLASLPEEIVSQSVIFVPFKGEFYKKLKSQGLNLYPFKMPYFLGIKIVHWKHFFSWIKGIYTLYRAKNIQWIYFNGLYQSELTIVIIKYLLRKKIIVHVRNLFASYNILRKSALLKADKIFCISKAVKENIPIKYHSKIVVMFNIVNHSITMKELDYPFSCKERKFRCAIFSRISPEKGQMDFLKIAKAYLSKNMDSEFHVFGSPLYGSEKYQKSLIEFVRIHQLDKHIHFHGYVEKVLNEIIKMDCVFCCSENEPLGRVIMEAMSIGRIVIANRTGGPLELIQDRVNGFLTNIENHDDSVRILEYCRDNPHIIKKISFAAYEFSQEHFSPEKYARRWLQEVSL